VKEGRREKVNKEEEKKMQESEEYRCNKSHLTSWLSFLITDQSIAYESVAGAIIFATD
jgi:hypothetical protein